MAAWAPQSAQGGGAGMAKAKTLEEGVVHILWMNGGLSCDGDSVALTAATQPSIEEIVLGALPGLPKIAVHWPLIDFECGPEQGADNFIEWWHKADRGELEPFVLVVEGSIPNEAIKREGYWCGFGNNPDTGQPMTTTEWLDRLAPKATAVVAVGTCATYGGIHAMAGNPTGAMGVPDYLGWDWKSKAGHPDRVRPGLPDPPRQPVRDDPLPAVPGRRPGADDPARRGAAPARGCSARPCTRAATGPATTSRATSPPSTARRSASSSSAAGARWSSATCPKRGWINGVGGCPNVGGICIGCTMPGFPDKFMPFMDEPPGAQGVDARPAASTAAVIRSAAQHHGRRPWTRSRSGGAKGDELTDRLPEDLVRR